MPKRREIDDRLHRRSGLPQRLRDAVVVAVGGRATVEDLPAARLGQNPSIAVLQHDDRALDHPSGLRMSLLVPLETVLQRFVHDVLHASVRRRVHLDPSLQKIFHAEVGDGGL